MSSTGIGTRIGSRIGIRIGIISTRPRRCAAVSAVLALALATCSSGDGAAGTSSSTSASAPPNSSAPATEPIAPESTDGTAGPDTTSAITTGAPSTSDPTEPTAPGADAWAVDTDPCSDPDAANAPIDGTVRIGSVMPLTGGVAAAAFAPVAEGFRAYVDFANQQGLLGDLHAELTIEDDQYDPELTSAAVTKLIDGGVDVVSGIVGSPDNAAVRDVLNEGCYPQLNALTGSPAWGDVAHYPWTTGLLVPYTVESKVYAAALHAMHPGGATVALFYVNNEFGQVYANTFKDVAGDYGLEIVDEQTVDADDTNPPISQVASIADHAPDAIVTVPLGPGCIGFFAELAAAKMRHTGWTPETFITNTCASTPVLRAAGPAADGVYTSGNLQDLTGPADADTPGEQAFVDYMTSIGKQDLIATAGAGWTTGEVTIAIIKQAMASADGLTRASIIEAARDFTFRPSLGRAGVELRSHGIEDAYLAESLQVLQYHAGTGGGFGTFTDVGDLITEFETR